MSDNADTIDVTHLHIREASDLDSLITVARLRFIHISSMYHYFSLRRLSYQSGKIVVEGFSLSSPTRILGESRPNTVSIAVVINSGRFFRLNNRVLQNGDLIVCGSGAHFEAAGGIGFELFGISIPSATLVEHLNICSNSDISLLDGKLLIFPALKSTSGLRDLWKCLRVSNKHSEIRELSIIEQFMDAFSFEYGNGSNISDQRPNHSLEIVLSSEEVMMSLIGEKLSIPSVCHKVGVSRRNLEYSFQHFMGISPSAYFRALKLNAARAQLKNGHLTRGAVKVAGYTSGFTRMSDFACKYNQLFHELPSETITRFAVN